MNLFPRICDAKPEDLTTEVLAYLLQEYEPCLHAFLSLLDSSIDPEACEVSTQFGIADGRPDLVLCEKSGERIVFIENKPWEGSTFTTIREEGDQLKRYANALKTEKATTKTLCLLAIERNKDGLLQAAATAAGVSPDAIRSHYSDEGIEFIVITWEQIFERIEHAFSDDSVPRFLIRELHDYLFPPAMKISPEILKEEPRIKENWEDIKTVVRQAKEILKRNDDISVLGHSTGPNGYYLCGYFLKDNLSNVTFWFGAWLHMRRIFGAYDVRSLFGMQIRFQKEQRSFHNTINRKTVIDPKVLENCGFINDLPQRGSNHGLEYIFPLSGSSDEHAISAEEVADAVAELLKKINDTLNKTENNS